MTIGDNMQRVSTERYMMAMQIFDKMHATECMIVATARNPRETALVFLPYTQDTLIARLVAEACIRWYQEHVA